MATKKKPSAAQLAARAKFAARVKSGEFKGARKRRKNPAAKAPAAKPRAAVRRNPAPAKRAAPRRRNPAPGYAVQTAGGSTIATASTAAAARKVAQAMADHTGRAHGYSKK